MELKNKESCGFKEYKHEHRIYHKLQASFLVRVIYFGLLWLVVITGLLSFLILKVIKMGT